MSLLAVLTVLALAGERDPPPPTLRLPGGVRPFREAVDLTLDPALATFSGSVEIDLDVREPLPVLWLNAVGLKLGEPPSAAMERRARCRSYRAARRLRAASPRERTAPRRLGAAAGPIRGPGVAPRQRGCLRRAGGRTPGTSSASSRRSRRAAPSRASTSRATRSPGRHAARAAGAVALSNSPTRRRATRGRATVHVFARTPPMPSYLVAFVVGPFEVVPVAPSGRKHVPTRLVVPRGRGADTA